MLVVTLAETERHRQALRREVEVQKEQAARLAGELEAARRIQMGLLPSVRALSGPATGVELEALLEPARTVGGDFYDCFKLDRHRLFFVVGDVSGKGMPAALFMSVSKAILKAMSVRAGSDIGSIMMRAGREIGRDNAEQLFVTLRTVEFHLTNVYRRFGLRNRAELTDILEQMGRSVDEAQPPRNLPEM